MDTKTVLITSAGVATAINVISALKKSTHYNVKLIAVDMNELAAGIHLADHGHTVPPVKDQNYLGKILQLVKQYGVGFIFPLYSGEIELFAGAAELFADLGVNICLPNMGVVSLCDDKLRFVDFALAKGFLCPRTYHQVEEIDHYPVFARPRRGSSSKGACILEDRQALDHYIGKNPNCIIQEYVSENEYTVDCLVDKNHRVIASVIRLRIGVKDGKSVVSRTIKSRIVQEEVHRLLFELGMVGPCNIQLFFNGETVRFIEVNPRLAAGGLSLSVAAGVNIPEMVLRLNDGEELQWHDYEEGLVMVRYLADLFVRSANIAEA